MPFDGVNSPKNRSYSPQMTKMTKMVKIAKNRFSISVTYGHVLPLYGFSAYLPTFFSVFGSLFIDFCSYSGLVRSFCDTFRCILTELAKISNSVKIAKNRVSSLTLYLPLLLQILVSVHFSISFKVSRAVIKRFYPS